MSPERINERCLQHLYRTCLFGTSQQVHRMSIAFPLIGPNPHQRIACDADLEGRRAIGSEQLRHYAFASLQYRARKLSATSLDRQSHCGHRLITQLCRQTSSYFTIERHTAQTINAETTQGSAEGSVQTILAIAVLSGSCQCSGKRSIKDVFLFCTHSQKRHLVPAHAFHEPDSDTATLYRRRLSRHCRALATTTPELSQQLLRRRIQQINHHRTSQMLLRLRFAKHQKLQRTIYVSWMPIAMLGWPAA
mmetsp:Transcript_90529/g.170649  ORF Transcript_90529/g.170649 Transcript_90529/m.170649 type:complete len:249 (+) Transcript_90529:44-790(+)